MTKEASNFKLITQLVLARPGIITLVTIGSERPLLCQIIKRGEKVKIKFLYCLT